MTVGLVLSMMNDEAKPDDITLPDRSVICGPSVSW